VWSAKRGESSSRASELPKVLSALRLVLIFAIVVLGGPGLLGLEEGDVARDDEPSRKLAGLIERGELDEALPVVLGALRGKQDPAGALEHALLVYDAFIRAGRAQDLVEPTLELIVETASDPVPYFLIGKVYLSQAGAFWGLTRFEGSFRSSLLYQASDAFRAALERDPDSVEAGKHLAYVLLLLDDAPAAQREAEALLVRHPNEAYLIYLIGEITLRDTRSEEALEAFQRAFAVDPTEVNALSGSVRALTALERPDEAAKVLVELVRVDSGFEALVPLASPIYESVADDLAAAELYRALLAIAPERYDVRLRLGVVEYRLGELNQSMRHLAAVLEQDGENGLALFYHGLILERLNRYEEAIETFIAILQLEEQPDFLEVTMGRLEWHANRKAVDGRFEAAITIYDQLLPLKPFDVALNSNKALALAQDGRTREAEELYLEVLELWPEDSAVINDYALLLMGTGRDEEALILLEKAFRIDGNLDACENLGSYYYYQLKDLTEAHRHFSRVLEAEPSREKALILREAIERHRGSSSGD